MSGEHLPYSQRAEWADVAPLPVTDDAGKVVAIQYDEQYKECLGYFRACLAKVGGFACTSSSLRGECCLTDSVGPFCYSQCGLLVSCGRRRL